MNLYRAPVLGGNPQLVVQDIDSDPSFSPDGRRMAYFRGNDPVMGHVLLLSANVDGTDEQVLEENSPFGDYLTDAAWSPDGKMIAYTDGFLDNNNLGYVRVFDIASGKSRLLYTTNSMVFSEIAWTAAQDELVVLYSTKSSLRQLGQIGIISYPDGHFRTLTNDTANYVSLSMSADGKTIVTVQSKTTSRLELLPPSGGGAADATPILTTQAPLFSFGWTPDGKILYTRDNQILVRSLAGEEHPIFTSDRDSPPKAANECADGRYVVFIWPYRNGQLTENIWRIDSDGGNPTQLTDEVRTFNPVCSPDSASILFIGDKGVRIVPIGGGAPRILSQQVIVSSAGFSPDGKEAIMLIDRLRPREERVLMQQPLPSGQPRFSAPVGDFSGGGISYTPDGKAAAYPVLDEKGDNVWIQPLDGSKGRTITSFTSDSLFTFHWSPDGQHLVVLRQHTDSDVVLMQDEKQQ